jgi:hypothetical protein
METSSLFTSMGYGHEGETVSRNLLRHGEVVEASGRCFFFPSLKITVFTPSKLIKVFTPLELNFSLRGHFEVTTCVLVTISNPNLDWL